MKNNMDHGNIMEKSWRMIIKSLNFNNCLHKSLTVVCNEWFTMRWIADNWQWLSQQMADILCWNIVWVSPQGFLDVSCSNGGLRISGWISQLSCLTIFSTSLSVAAFLRRAGGSTLESTRSRGRGVEQRVPEMRRMVEFNCTSTRLVWAEHDQTGAQYSAAE